MHNDLRVSLALQINHQQPSLIFVSFFSWKNTSKGTLAIVPEYTARISQCFLLVRWSLSKHFLPHFVIEPFLTVCFLTNLGLSDIPGEAMVKLYCPKCMDVYTPKSSRHHHTDGAYFGTGFPHMLFMVNPEYRPKRPANQFVPRFVHVCKDLYLMVCFKKLGMGCLLYEPEANFCCFFFRLYGFKIHPMAYQLQLQAASSFKSPAKTIR